jgi:sugar/nucleoside kinase (ribokinase family)
MDAPLTSAAVQRHALVLPPHAPYRRLIGVGGIGSGMFFALEGEHELGRNESRPARLLDVRDYCKLHIVAHYPTVLLGAREDSGPFHVVPVGKVGIDEVGLRLRAEMEHAGMDVRFVDAVPGHPTLLSVCFQYKDGSGGNFTTTDSAAALVSERDVDAVERWLSPAAIALAAPEVPLAVRRHLLRRATERGALRVASLTLADVEEARATRLLDQVDLLAVNADEAGALAGEPFPDGPPSGFLERLGRRLRARQPSLRLLVTAGARGAFALDGEAWSSASALPVRVVSSAGAGDALLGATLAGLAAGLPLVSGRNHVSRPGDGASELASALDLGALVAAFKVTSPHTIPPDLSLDALLAFAAEQHVAFGPAFRALLPERGEERHAS